MGCDAYVKLDRLTVSALLLRSSAKWKLLKAISSLNQVGNKEARQAGTSVICRLLRIGQPRLQRLEQ